VTDSPRASLSIRGLMLSLFISVVAALVAYGVGHALSKTYQASGTLRVAAPTQSGISDPNVTAANDLASQYAPLVGENPVAALAAKHLRVTAQSLKNKLSGSTVSAQNILQVTATAASAGKAESIAAAGVRATQQYLGHVTSVVNDQYVKQLQTKIKATPVVTRSGVSADASVQIANTRAVALYDALRDAAGNQPTFQIVNLTGSASVVSPKPKLYALVAFVIVLLISLRVVFVTKKTV
jgi:capsular polysaccharide biosynthesis protein